MTVDQAAKAMGHPLRVSILADFRRVETDPKLAAVRKVAKPKASPSMLAERLKAPLGNISYHVRILYDLGAVEKAGTVPRRGATEHYYRLSEDGRRLMDETPAWLTR